jgi:putative endopeptidase
MKKTGGALAAGAMLGFFACQAGAADAPVSATAALVSGIDTQYEDRSVRPQDDIYRYVNGKWLDGTEIPADKALRDNFELLGGESDARMKLIVEAAVKDTSAAAGSEQAKIRDLYNSFMDESRIEALGLKPLEPELARLQAVKSVDEMPALFAHWQRIGVTTPFEATINLDGKDSTQYAFYLSQSGLSLPGRDYYLKKDDPKLTGIRDDYRQHLVRILGMLGDKNAKQEAVQILALETRIAQAHWTPVENRDPIKTYNKIELAKLHSLAKGFDWHQYLVAFGIDDKVRSVIVEQPSYLSEFSKLLRDTPLPAWKAYFRYRLVDSVSGLLPKVYHDQFVSFYDVTLGGIPEQAPRPKRAVWFAETGLPDALGKLYVAKYFPTDRKARVEALVQYLLAVYRQEIQDLDWMGPQTKQQALLKLSKMAVRIGYPGDWHDYSSFKVSPEDLWGNFRNMQEFAVRFRIDKLGRPADRTEWTDAAPDEVNASYDLARNDLTFPAAILQPPFFDAAADDAVNYGAIGAVIGHEISHAFDDQGSQFDGDGNLRNWWTEEDRQRFKAKTRPLVAEYSAFEPVAGYHYNGEQVLGEVIADNSGLAIAYKAYKLSLGGKRAPVIDGMSGEQRFYLGFAQMYRAKLRDNLAIQVLKTDPHPFAATRVLGALVNQDGFYEAFNVKPGDKMYVPPEQRIVVW